MAGEASCFPCLLREVKAMNLKRKTAEDEIRAKAHEIYECGGRVEGRDLDNWIAAEHIVYARHAEKVSRMDEDEAFSGMPFEGSEW